MQAKFLRVPEFAERLGIADKTARGWILAGKVDVHRFGRSVRISEDTVQKIIQEGFQPARRSA